MKKNIPFPCFDVSTNNPEDINARLKAWGDI
jgi:hypothetical protein